MSKSQKKTTEVQVLESLDVLRARREDVFALVNAIHENSKGLTQDSFPSFGAQLQHLERLEKEFSSVQDEIRSYNSMLEDKTGALDTTKVSLSFNELLWAIRATSQRYEKPPESKFPAMPPICPSISLAPMQIPSFDGDVSRWTEFKALYDQLIHHNTTLNEVQKLYYLKTLVTGEAARVISTLDLSTANYSIAYAALTKRYSSPRRIANRYMSEILHFKVCGKESEYLSVHENAVKSLKALQIADLADYVLFRICYENLPSKTKHYFDDRCDTQRVPTCQELFDFVLHQTQTAELRCDVGPSKSVVRGESRGFTRKQSPKTFLVGRTSKNSANEHIQRRDDPRPAVICPVCQGGHLIYACSNFLQLAAPSRRDLIQRLERCFNCLGQHQIQNCKSKNTCNRCKKQHHSFLHLDAVPNDGEQRTSVTPRCHFLNAESSSVVVLGTFLAQIRDKEGVHHQIRGVMDTGSHISAISKSMADLLGLKPEKAECSVTGLAESTSRSTELIHVTLRSCRGDQTPFRFPAHVFPKLCHDIPSQPIVPPSELTHISNLNLADPFYDQPGPVDLLLSAEMSAAILSRETPNLIVGQPTAVRTAFGWILYGSIPIVFNHPRFASQTLFTLQDHLHKFWEVEEVPRQDFTSPEEDWCEQHFQKTHSRDSTGRYIVALPFRPECPPLGNNRDHAMKRWVQLEKKLSSVEDRRAAYNAVLEDYLKQNHMEIASSPSSYILPHHSVYKTSTTTKLRVVFDASCRDSKGLSLNDRLWTGPKLQKDIVSIIASFRSFRYAVCGDIAQMYRMIWLHRSDRYCQHVFWRKTAASDITEFELRTLTFGLAPAPFLAQRVIRQLVEDEGNQYSLASSILKHHIYMDDIITGVDSIDEGQRLQRQLIDLLAKGGFHLRRWSSNSQQLLLEVPPEDRETLLEFHDGSQGLKVLGCFWNPTTDIFTYQVKPFEGRITKRTILSFIARVYDPMGWLAPVLIVAKCFLQSLWLLKLDWDTEVPAPVREKWSSFAHQFHKLSRIEIPRQLNPHPRKPHHRYNLIGFCDASETAYAACVYLQNIDFEPTRLVLLQAKTKVAPLKSLTVPCLELCAALLLTRLLSSLTRPFPIRETLYFTDSKIVLTWLQTPLYRLKIFVANRVSQILETSNLSQWNHIPGTRNPADLASRGLQPENLLHSTLWWTGPENLPERSHLPTVAEAEVPELKHDRGSVFLLPIARNFMRELTERFSSWIRLQRVMAWTLRFIHNCRFPTQVKKGWLTTAEHQSARHKIILLTQQHYYSAEIRDIQNNQIPRSLLSLHPFLDQSGCLRVGGRLRHSSLSFTSKHPLLIPATSHLAALVVRYYHETSLHSGPSTVQALVQRRYWIPSLRNLVRKHTFRCIRCHRLKAHAVQPRMGDLPAERVTVSRPFSHTATDFAGPFVIKESTRRNARLQKCYLCIFVCMSTKAVHLEPVTSLSTEAFLATFTRFAGRRGLPNTIVSDNGRNFVGASRELRELQSWLQEKESEIGSSLATQEICWKFNPPAAPHFGGLFEAAIKSAKLLMNRCIGTHTLTLEEMITLFSRIEAALNSRPLTQLSSDPGEDYLAPSHFLIGGFLHQVPEPPIEDQPLTSRWKRVQQLGQQFWKRWSTQYLQQLIPRTRWKREDTTIKVGDLVYVQGQTTSPLTWPLGRVIECFPGKDGVTRVASVRTSSGSYIRPTNKLIAVPLN